jgi:hypothetical protein
VNSPSVLAIQSRWTVGHINRAFNTYLPVQARSSSAQHLKSQCLLQYKQRWVPFWGIITSTQQVCGWLPRLRWNLEPTWVYSSDQLTNAGILKTPRAIRTKNLSAIEGQQQFSSQLTNMN